MFKNVHDQQTLSIQMAIQTFVYIYISIHSLSHKNQTDGSVCGICSFSVIQNVQLENVHNERLLERWGGGLVGGGAYNLSSIFI